MCVLEVVTVVLEIIENQHILTLISKSESCCGTLNHIGLFLCYVNDMPNSVNCMLLQYADDSALIYSDKDPEKMQEFLVITWQIVING